VETIATYPDLISAQLAQSLLQAEGIVSTIPEENIAGIDWQWSTALQGIRLQVAANDADSALELLSIRPGLLPDDYLPDIHDVGPQDRCPHCGSDLMGSQRWRRRGKALTMLVPILLLLWPLVLAFGPRYECTQCGRLWKETNVTPRHTE
jgi:DNA-directed RNA polymerase subunit RPC12/RpoP